ncbi:MAG: glycosyltransferase [Bacteroidota bacterium]|nr:glycosyltransferase [Bacteroidota bacterium]
MSQQSTLISAIISTYNSEAFMQGRLENLVDQTIFPQIEIIVINSGSQQKEEEIVKEFQKRYSNIYYISTTQRETIYQAWNRGIKLAKGKYITNANTDDRLHPNALEILTKTMKSNPNVGLVYADQVISDEPNALFNDTKDSAIMKRPRYSRLRLLAGHIVGPQAVWKASLHFQDQIWFDENYEVAGDYDFVCRVAEKYPILHFPQILGSYYLCKDKSNKEYQDIEKTAVETAEIQIRYGKRYITTLDTDKRKRLKNRLLLYLRLPPYFHVALFRLSKTLFPKHYILPRAFVSWMSALLLMNEGDKETAIMLCKSCLKYPRAVTSRILLQELQNSENKQQ